jgi:pimeloyl-ACP methyl ester carboxylesterase
MFFNPGGPGEAGAEFLKDPESAQLLADAGQGRFDVVSWDPRGTGESRQVRCFRSKRSEKRFWGDLAIPSTRAGSRRYITKAVAYGRRCGQVSGRLLAHISTLDTVRDLDHLRKLVGERQITYYGVSYGTYIGQTYANVLPRRVRAMVLDGVVDAVRYSRGRESALDMFGLSYDPVFARFEALCERQGPERCALAGHGSSVAARVSSVLTRLRQGPLAAPTASPPGDLTYGEALTAIFPFLRAPINWPKLAEAFNAAADGDGSLLATTARTSPPALGSKPAAVAIGCADSPARKGPGAWPQVIGQATRASRLGGPVLGWWLWAPCSAWPARSAAAYSGPWNRATKTPVLVVGTRWDPNTAYVNAQVTARRLGNATLLTQNGYGHISFQDPSTCVVQAIGRYLTTLTAPPRGTVCPSDREPFDPNFGVPLP